MAKRRLSRNNLAAGVFVLAAISVATAAVITLAGAFDQLGKTAYTAEFPLDIGVAGLDIGSNVTLGGREIGFVRSVKFDRADDGSVARVLVTMAIDKKLRLHENAVAYLEKPLLGSSASINFASLGEMGEPVASAKTILRGAQAPPSILASAGYGEDQAQQLKNIMRRMDEITEKVSSTIDDFNATAYPDTKLAIAEGKGLVADARERSRAWFDRVDSITKNIDETAARAPALADDLQSRVDEIKDLLASAQSYLNDNRENIDAAIANARQGTEKANEFLDRLKGELSDQTSELLTRGKDAMDRANIVLEETESTLREHRPDIRRSMANFRLGSDQLKATVEEVRASPWRLLYRPDTRELEYELLYDSARSYASAVSDLRSITDALREAQSAGGPVADESRINALLDTLDHAFQTYRTAEERFLDELMGADQSK
ncbi:MAG: hypothetical protein H6812_01995 [Phycisphaeraceae bacterium]|nr:hypothetical protein [Phycisphaerales bacterium]MCB9842009.1 hypothetical protein [Phycisphaeraceae bacterium]